MRKLIYENGSPSGKVLVIMPELGIIKLGSKILKMGEWFTIK